MKDSSLIFFVESNGFDGLNGWKIIIKYLNVRKFGMLWNEAKVNNSHTDNIIVPIMRFRFDIHT